LNPATAPGGRRSGEADELPVADRSRRSRGMHLLADLDQLHRGDHRADVQEGPRADRRSGGARGGQPHMLLEQRRARRSLELPSLTPRARCRARPPDESLPGACSSRWCAPCVHGQRSCARTTSTCGPQLELPPRSENAVLPVRARPKDVSSPYLDACSGAVPVLTARRASTSCRATGTGFFTSASAGRGADGEERIARAADRPRRPRLVDQGIRIANAFPTTV